MIIRQGDVLLVKREMEGERVVQPKGKRIVLAEGETTGHAHAIDARDADVVEAGGLMFVVVPDEATLVHEEHAPAKLFGGEYLTGAQVEYAPAAIRRVLD